MAFRITATIASFGGKLLKLKQDAALTGFEMALNLYLPPSATPTTKAPLLVFLSGLTCTGDNCAEKGFLQSRASQRGIAIVFPDTSPRDLNIPGEDDAYDFGTGASFYIDATAAPWATYYKMESYITSELPKALFSQFAELDSSRISITGHSMGGHGALTLYLKNPGMYKSVSAFAPICNPINCPWGQKAFSGYLGNNREDWKAHDATELVASWKGELNCLIDVGTADTFYQQKQLLPENFVKAAKSIPGHRSLNLRYQDVSILCRSMARRVAKFDKGYDHSYYFVSTFAADHIDHAAKFLFA